MDIWNLQKTCPKHLRFGGIFSCRGLVNSRRNFRWEWIKGGLEILVETGIGGSNNRPPITEEPGFITRKCERHVLLMTTGVIRYYPSPVSGQLNWFQSCNCEDSVNDWIHQYFIKGYLGISIKMGICLNISRQNKKLIRCFSGWRALQSGGIDQAPWFFTTKSTSYNLINSNSNQRRTPWIIG